MSVRWVKTPVFVEFFLVSLLGAFCFVRVSTDFFRALVTLIYCAILTPFSSVSRIFFHVVSVSEWFDLVVLLIFISDGPDVRWIVIVIGVVISPKITLAKYRRMRWLYV